MKFLTLIINLIVSLFWNVVDKILQSDTVDNLLASADKTIDRLQAVADRHHAKAEDARKKVIALCLQAEAEIAQATRAKRIASRLKSILE